jgi:hypothetical protein
MAMAATRPALSSLPKGVTLGRIPARLEEYLSSGNPRLDRLLGGGFPRGRLSEIYGATSSGRTSLAYGLLASATRNGETVALVDCRDRFDPRLAAAAGIRLRNLLWVRPPDERGALRSSEILLGTQGLRLVLLDLADGLSPVTAACFAPAWPRLARQATASNVALVLLSRERLAGSVVALCLTLRNVRPHWPKHTLRAELLHGIASRAEIVRAREGALAGRQAELHL